MGCPLRSASYTGTLDATAGKGIPRLLLIVLTNVYFSHG
jgi:hypothetical protein